MRNWFVRGVKLAVSWVIVILAALGVLSLLAMLLVGCTRERIVYVEVPTEADATPPQAASEPPSLEFPQGIPDSQIIVVPGVPTLYNEVNEEIAAMFPNCQVGQTNCDGLGHNPQGFYFQLNERLRARGLWAGQHREGHSDEITVARECNGVWENYKAWVYLGYPQWAKPHSTPCAGDACLHKGSSYRGNTIIPSGFCK